MADILVIDDMAGVRRAIASSLKRAGHTVTEVSDGAVGLRLAGEHRFDLIITDIVMPGVDGTEVIRALAAVADRPPIIVMSGGGAHVTSDSALLLAKQTADASLTKPFGSEELIEAVDRLLASQKGSTPSALH
jgi:CheY-like chemotaxis protein